MTLRGKDRQAKTHEVAESIPVTPQMYQKLTAKIAGKPEERILSYLMLRSSEAGAVQREECRALCAGKPKLYALHFADSAVSGFDCASVVAGADSEWCESGGSGDLVRWTAAVGREGRLGSARERAERTMLEGPIPEAELGAIAAESSQSERRADDAERELIEWKKIKFMQDRVGEDFNAIILSCTKYGFFVELDDLFIEGLVPLTSLQDDRYMFRDTDRQIVGTRNGRVFRMGQRVHVLLDRIDRQQRRLQFALLPSEEDVEIAPRSLRRSKTAATASGERPHPSPNRSGKKGKTKSKARERNKKAKGKRR